jgi:DNA-binding NtrC family response regulator
VVFPEKNAESLDSVEPSARATVHVLIVEDEESLLESCATVLRHEGYQVMACARGAEARELLQRRSFDIVLIDLHMADVSGMELLRTTIESKSETFPIVMTGDTSVTSSIRAVQAGAWDYLPKPFSASHLQIVVGRACHAVLEARELAGDGEVSDHSTGASGRRASPPDGGSLNLLGRSPAILKTIERARTVARTDASVFITGESGSGKEVIAQFIHQNSRRSTRPIVAINCAALPEALLESEMFGHVKGAFTGAIRDKPGLLETASGGTLFLDELTEMSLPIQAKLLRVIQDGLVRRVGSESVDAVVDVRFIAATNRDPRQAVTEGELRKDLFYRLNVVPLPVPPLRERREDIPLLAEHFLRHYWKRHRDGKSPIPRLSDEAKQSLQSRWWSGNVRELQNVIEHAVVLLDPGTTIGSEDIPYLEESEPSAGSLEPIAGPGMVDLRRLQEKSYHAAREEVTTEFERFYLRWLIDAAGGNMSKAAKIAGVDRATLYRLMEKHGIERNTTIRSKNDS